MLADKGIAQVGTPMDLYERPANEKVALFIGSPAMNLLPGKVTATGAQTQVQLEHGEYVLSDIPTTEADMGKTVNIGVRPEHLEVTEGAALFRGRIDFTEALGEVTLLYFETVGTDPALIAKLNGVHAGLRGQTMGLTAAPENVHLFHQGESMRP